MTDKKDIDFDTLPSSSDDLIDDDDIDGFEENDDDLSFDDEDSDIQQDEYDEDNSEGESDEDVDEHADEYDDESDGEDEEGQKSSSKVKDIALYGGGGVVFIAVAAYYLQSVLGLSLFGGSESVTNNSSRSNLSEIENRSQDLRDIPASKVVEARDSTIFDIDGGWDGDDGQSNVEETFDSIVIESKDDDSSFEGDSRDTYRYQDDNNAALESAIQKLSVEVESVVKDAVGELLTKSHFDESINVLGDSLSSDLEHLVKDSELRVSGFIEELIEESSFESLDYKGEEVNHAELLESRSRLPNINIIDISANGEMIVVENGSGDKDVLSIGEAFTISGVSHKVSSIVGNGMLALVGDKYFIDTERYNVSSGVESSKDRPVRSSLDEEKVKANIQRLRAEKSVADSLLRDYKSHKVEYSLIDIPKKSRRATGVSDYVMSHQPPSSDNSLPVTGEFLETPRQSKLIIAEGWVGSMIMGDEFLVVDPGGSWRKFKKGDRVSDFNNNLVHGLDSRNNLIIGNHVILYK